VSIEAEHAVTSDTTRAEAFSDAVLAIVITLLVLDLKAPEHEPGQLLRGLLAQWPTYLAYVTSYLYIAVVWLNHKAAFHRIRAMTRGMHWANLAVLFTTALLPWPTAVVARVLAEENLTDAKVSIGLYDLVGVLLCLSWLLFFHVVGRHPELTEDDVDERFFPAERVRAGIGTLAYGVAGLVGVFVLPLAGLLISLLVPVFYAVTSHGYEALPKVARRVLPVPKSDQG
jgi:uncharacterized membrane protein